MIEQPDLVGSFALPGTSMTVLADLQRFGALAELEQADEYVFGVPIHNFGVPSVLKLWIDQIARVGRTLSYADGTPSGANHRTSIAHSP